MFSPRLKRLWRPIGQVFQRPQGLVITHETEGEAQSNQSRMRELAQDLLASLSGKRIDRAKISFVASGRSDSGGKGDVVVATIIVDGGSATSPEGKQVAVKKLKFSRETDRKKMLKAFVNELRVLDGLSHPHIVTMMGFVEDIENGILWMVFPWEANGNVREFLRSGEWEIPERVSLIKDVARGLEYLHTRQPPICHGDLKSLNILVNDSCRAIITDFGSARVMGQESRTNREVAPMNLTDAPSDQSWQIGLAPSDKQLTLTGPRWSLRWAAPEILNGQEPDLASDIWALGWIGWEVMTDNYPFAETGSEGLITLKVTGGALPSMDAHDRLSQIRRLCGILMKCWKAGPKKRPSAVECRKNLDWIPSSVPVAQTNGQSSIRSAALLYQLGEMHRLHNRNDEATETLEQGLAIAQSTNDKQRLATIILTLGELQERRSKYAEAEERYTQALEIYTSIGDDLGRANTLKGLGDVQQMRSKYAEAEERYTQALVIYTSIGDVLGLANTLQRLGGVQEMRSKYVEAEERFTQALEIYTSIGDDLGRANTLKGLGDVQQMRSKHAEAEERYTQALEIYTSIGEDLGRANTLKGLGDVQRMRSKYAEAEERYTQALEIYTSIGDDLGRAEALKGLGDVQQMRAKYAEAEECYAQALEIYTSIGNDLGRAVVLDWLGDVQRARSKYREAEECYSQALEIYKRTGNQSGQTNSSLGLGEIRLRQARYAEAKALITDAAEIAERIDYPYGEMRSKELLAEVLHAENSSAEPMTST